MVDFKFFIVLCFGFVSIPTSESSKILAVLPFPGKSHFNVYNALTKELARQGHEVTVVSPFKFENNLTNYKELVLDIDFRKHMDDSQVSLTDLGNLKQHEIAIVMFMMGQKMCEGVLEHQIMKDLINTKEKYDLIITSTFFMECVYGLQHKLNIPLVQICTYHGSSWLWYFMGNPIEFASFPETFLNYSNEMTFFERVWNYVIGLMWISVRNLYHVPAIDAQIKKAFGPDTPSMKEIEARTSLLLLNSDIAFSYARAQTPNIIKVGGMHIKPPKPLPEELQKWLDQSKKGVVYFSMGSNFKSTDLDKSTINNILKVFGELKENVLWKWEDDDLPGKPANVRISKWLPQNDLLAHPNIKLFVTHGGLLSTQEATYHGIPLVGIPVFGDQAVNMRRVEKSGNGVLLELANITETSFRWAVNTALLNPSYKNVAKKTSAIYRDQPQTPLDRAVFWTEYVIRHKGAPHLRPASANLFWWQRELLDVILFLIVCASSSLLLLGLLVKRLCCRGNKKHPATTKTKKHN